MCAPPPQHAEAIATFEDALETVETATAAAAAAGSRPSDALKHLVAVALYNKGRSLMHLDSYGEALVVLEAVVAEDADSSLRQSLRTNIGVCHAIVRFIFWRKGGGCGMRGGEGEIDPFSPSIGGPNGRRTVTRMLPWHLLKPRWRAARPPPVFY